MSVSLSNIALQIKFCFHFLSFIMLAYSRKRKYWRALEIDQSQNNSFIFVLLYLLYIFKLPNLYEQKKYKKKNIKHKIYLHMRCCKSTDSISECLYYVWRKILQSWLILCKIQNSGATYWKELHLNVTVW